MVLNGTIVLVYRSHLNNNEYNMYMLQPKCKAHVKQHSNVGSAPYGAEHNKDYNELTTCVPLQ